MKKLTVEAIDFKYAEKTIFHHASMRVESGSISGLLGANGSGKTTFFDIVCGLRKVGGGAIYNDFSSQLYLSQIVTTPPVLRMHDVFKMIVLFCSGRKITQENSLRKLESWSPDIVERYQDIWKRKSSLCSYGEKRWFFTLSLLSVDADFVILDEPTAGVDPEFRSHIWRCLQGAASEGVAILVSSHNVDEVVNGCDDFYMIGQQRFNHFVSAEGFMSQYNAKHLDEAFINAATMSKVDRCSF